MIEAKRLAAKRLADADAEAARRKDTEAEDAAILASYNMNVELARNGFQCPDALEFFDASDAFARQDQGLALADLDQVQ